MANSERLIDFPAKTSPASTDIIYVGDMSNSGNEVKSTISQILTSADNVNVKLAGSTMTGSLILSGDPIVPLQAVTKQYVDNAISTLFWATVSTNTTMAADSAYIANSGSLITFTLPTTASVGTSIRIEGYGAGGWAIAQNANQQIILGNVSTTVGAGGSVASQNQYDSITLTCIVANNIWKATAVGQLTLN